MATQQQKSKARRTIDLSAAEARATIESYCEAINDHDISAILELSTDQISITWIPVQTFDGKGSVREALEELFTAFPDFAREDEIVAVDGNCVVLKGVATGTFTGGPFVGYEPTGAAGQVRILECVTLKGSHVDRIETYWDGMEMARNLGLLPDADSLGDRLAKGATNLVTKAKHIRK